MKHLYQAVSIALLLLSATALSVQAQPVFFVDADATGTNNGTSWTDAFTDLQEALAVALNGDEIWVAEGTYKPIVPADSANVTDVERSARFQLRNGVGLYGGFAGTEASRDERDIPAHPTILSGDLLGNDNDVINPDEPTRAENSWHVVKADDLSAGPVNAATVLDGFFITGGNANELPPNTDDTGGGLLIVGSQGMFSELTVRNVVFTANTARFGGGAGCAFSAPTFSHVVFIGNAVSGEMAGDGGGMQNLFCASTLRNVRFRNNTAERFGGGLMNNRGTTLMNGVTFIENNGERGGGMYNLDDNAVVVNAVFFSNVAVISGGGMYNDESPAAVMNALFSGNRTLDPERRGGGAMGNFREEPFLTNLVFYGNSSARDGGALFNINSNPTIINSILWNNQADGEQDELFSGGLPGGNPRVFSSIVEGGLPPGITDGGGNLNADPLFADADGADDLPGTIDDDFRLMPGSPAIDVGNNAGLLFDVLDLDRDGNTQDQVSIDLDGNLRVHDAGGGAVVDLGAYEFGAAGVLVATEEATELPESPLILAAYPNPFRGQATLRYALSASGHATLKVYDMLGREVATLIDDVLPAGTHTVHFEAPHLASGVYLYHLEAAGRTATRKMLLVR